MMFWLVYCSNSFGMCFLPSMHLCPTCQYVSEDIFLPINMFDYQTETNVSPFCAPLPAHALKSWVAVELGRRQLKRFVLFEYMDGRSFADDTIHSVRYPYGCVALLFVSHPVLLRSLKMSFKPQRLVCLILYLSFAMILGSMGYNLTRDASDASINMKIT